MKTSYQGKKPTAGEEDKSHVGDSGVQGGY